MRYNLTEALASYSIGQADVYIFITRLPWPGDRGRDLLVFESSWHRSTTHDGGFTLSLIAERRARKLQIPIFIVLFGLTLP